MIILKEDLDWLRKEIAQTPGDSGWWSKDNGEDFVVLAVELMDKGLDRYEALEILTRAYWAVANEFGV